MKRSLWAASALLVATAPFALAAPQKSHKTSTKTAPAKEAAVTPKQENQFVTVDEFVKSKKAPHTAVSVEGYAVVGYSVAGGEKIFVVDSIDHVLSPTDANNFAKGGAAGTIPSSAISKHPSWGMSAKGLHKVLMYTGAGTAQKVLHDTPAKVRITGWTAGGKAISPVMKVEYQDENGEWKNL